MTTTAPEDRATWIDVCALDAIVPDTGVCGLVAHEQVAVFRLASGAVHAVGNLDPFSGVACLSRGIVGDVAGTPVVAAPVYKQRFSLETGRCLDDEAVTLPVFAVRVADDRVEISLR
jgi:nitrite reductase (NADH) small subunit